MRIDIKTLSRKMKEAREDFERNVENGLCDVSDYRDELRCAVRPYAYLWQPKAKPTAADLRAELTTAAAAAGQFGASQAQINYIVSLAEKSGDFTGLGYGRLTKAQASRIIDTMKR